MSSSTVTRPGEVPELLPDQLDLVAGGIIIVSGLVARGSVSTISFNGTNAVPGLPGTSTVAGNA